MGKLKRDERQLRLLVWSQHLEGKSNRAVARDLKLCRNRVNALIKLGPPPEFVRKEEVKAGPVESDHHKEARLLKEVESRLSPEQRRREAEFKAVVEYLTNLRRKRFPEIGDGYTCDPDF